MVIDMSFGAQKVWGVQMRPRKLQDVYCTDQHKVHTECSSSPIRTEVTNSMSTVYTTVDYEYRHENKGTDLALVPRKCGVYN